MALPIDKAANFMIVIAGHSIFYERFNENKYA